MGRQLFVACRRTRRSIPHRRCARSLDLPRINWRAICFRRSPPKTSSPVARYVSLDSGAVLVLTQPTRVTTTNTPTALIARARVCCRARGQARRRFGNGDHTGFLSARAWANRIGGGRFGRTGVRLAPGQRHASDSQTHPFQLRPDRVPHGRPGRGFAGERRPTSRRRIIADGVIRSTGVGPLNGRHAAAPARRRRRSTSTASVRDDAVADDRASLAPRDLDLLFQTPSSPPHFTAPRVGLGRRSDGYRERALRYARGRTSDPDADLRRLSVGVVTRAELMAESTAERLRASQPAVDLGRAIGFWRARHRARVGLHAR